MHNASMAIRIVRLGSPRAAHEGLRLGTVRRPPRGVARTEYATRDFFDLWLPILAPSAPAVALALKARSPRDWQRFERCYRREMGRAGPREVLALLAALSHRTALSVGCYCHDETRCHRSILKALLLEQGATVRTTPPEPAKGPTARRSRPRSEGRERR